MNTLQKTISDAVYKASREELMYEDAYEVIIEALKQQKVDFEEKGLVPTMDLLIEELEYTEYNDLPEDRT